MDKTKFAVVGCGHIGMRHAEMISNNPACELIALCDIKKKYELNLSDYNLPFFQDIHALLNSTLNFDIVNICTPNGLHALHAMASLHHNKNIVIEKPMALSVKDCNEIIALAKSKNKKVFCVMQNRYSPPAEWLKNVIDKNILGEIFYVQINCFWNRDERYYTKDTWHGNQQLDGGTLFTQFSHFIDLMLWLFGDIKNIQATFSNFNHKQLTDFEDSGFINFDFKTGGKGSFNYSTSVYENNFESSVTIIAEQGTIKVGGQYMEKVEYCNIKNYEMPQLEKTNHANDYGSYKGSANNHHYIIQNVVDVLKGKEKKNTSAIVATTAEEGLLVVDVIERIYAQKKIN